MRHTLPSKRQTTPGRGAVAAVAVVLALGASGCSSTDEVVSSARQAQAGSGARSEATTTESKQVDRADLLFAGLPLGSSDVFDTPTSLNDLVAESAATISGSVVGYQILQEPELTSLSYSGPGGVVRLQIEVDAMYGPTLAVAGVAGAGGKPVVNVDYPNWITGSSESEFHKRLESAVAARPPVFLILRAGTTDGVRATGAYTPVWVPLGVLDVVDGKLAVPSIDRELVERDALARGEERSQAAVEEHVEDEAGKTVEEAAPPGLLDKLNGKSLDDVAQTPGLERRQPVGGANLQDVLDRS